MAFLHNILKGCSTLGTKNTAFFSNLVRNNTTSAAVNIFLSKTIKRRGF